MLEFIQIFIRFVITAELRLFFKEVMDRVEEKYLRPIDENIARTRRSAERLLEQQKQTGRELDELLEKAKKMWSSSS
jgi:phage shock protein A